MNILYVSDNNGIMVLGVSLTSLFINNSNVEQLNIYVVDDHISQNNKQRLLECAAEYGRKLYFIKMPKIIELIGIEPPKGKWPSNVFCRLFTPTLFQSLSIDRVIYLDTDTIVNKNITELWNADIEGYSCGAVLECMGDLHKKAIGLEADTPYLNSGMLLIDVKKWKDDELESKCRFFLKKKHASLEYPDEGVINGVLDGGFKILPPEYNLTTLKCIFDYQELKWYRKSRCMYELDAYIKANEHPYIVHYTNSFMADRPWIRNSSKTHRYSDLWNSYKSKSIWKDEPLVLKKKNARGAMERIIHVLPRKMVIIVMGFIFCYIKPLKYIWGSGM